MVNTKISFTPEFLTGGGVSPYESPTCEAIRINVSGPLCQSGLVDPEVDLGTDLDLEFGGDL
jgi:hypothetical protein